MIKTTLAVLAGAAALTLAAAPASAQQVPQLTYEQQLDCSAMFLIQSKLLEGEEKGAFEAAVGAMLNRAVVVAQGRGLNQDQVIEQAAAIADTIEGRVSNARNVEEANQIIWNWGPGMSTCIDSVLAE